MELSAQMEAMKLEMMGAHYSSTGNSLFGEVRSPVCLSLFPGSRF